MTSVSEQEKYQRECRKLEKRLRRQVGQAVHDFSLIEDGDVVMVCLSGGKDSYTLLDILQRFSEIAPIRFQLIAVNVDQGHPGFPKEILPTYVHSRGIPFHAEYQNTLEIVERVLDPTQIKCSLCSRLRRGILYRLAREQGATKIALGHHRDDIIETFFLNIFFGGQIKTMPPKLHAESGQIVIRPLAYVSEEDTQRWAEYRQFPIIPCNLCGNQENSQRAEVKVMLKEWHRRYPGRIPNIFRSLSHLVPSHMLDRRFWETVDNFSKDVGCVSADMETEEQVAYPVHWVL